MARVTPFPNMVCGICKAEFSPTKGQYYNKKEGSLHCCSKACWRLQKQQSQSKLPIGFKLGCAACGEAFVPSRAQRYKYTSKSNYNPCCSEQCYSLVNSDNMKRRLREGITYWFGSPAQLASAKKLGEYSRANKKFGPEHPNWRNGLTTTEMLEVRKLRMQIQEYIKEGAKA